MFGYRCEGCEAIVAYYDFAHPRTCEPLRNRRSVRSANAQPRLGPFFAHINDYLNGRRSISP